MSLSLKWCFVAYVISINDSVEGTVNMPGNTGRRIKKQLTWEKSLCSVFFESIIRYVQKINIENIQNTYRKHIENIPRDTQQYME